MELRSVDARPGGEPPETDQPPEAGRAATAPPVVERERLAVPSDLQRLPARPPARVDLGRQRLAERLERVENPASNRSGLQERLKDLPPGHPSSPWEEDGTPRPPAPRLADLERLDPPLSDAAYAAHRDAVKDRLERAIAAGLTTKDQFAIDKDGQAWTVERRWLHDQIITQIYNSAAHVPCERRAVIAGGLGGAGKTTVLEQHANIDRANFLTINPDEIKEELARRGTVPEVPGLSPMEASSLVHEESSHIARMLAGRALADGKNVIWDVTLSTPQSAAHRVGELRAAGYHDVQGIFVDIPIETSVTRAIARHRRGHDQYLAGEGLGGRYLSEDIIRSQADPNHGSINRKAFESIKHELDYWAIYDNSTDGSPPVLLEQGGREHENRIHKSRGLI